MSTIKTSILTEDNEKFLQTLIEYGIIAPTAVGSIEEMTKKETKKKVIDKLGYCPKIYTRNDGRQFIKIKTAGDWKSFYATCEADLYSKVYSFLFGDSNITLEEVYRRFMLYRRDRNKVTPKTIRENANDWNRFLKDSELAQKPICSITTKDYLHFFEEITLSRTLTNKAVTNLKSLLNKIYGYCIREELVEQNPLVSIDFSEFDYFVPDNSRKVYSVEDRDHLLEYLYNIKEPYSLAIQLAFQITCRIGELEALCWEDIDFDARTISISKQATRESLLNDDLSFSAHTMEIVPRTKGNSSSGKRVLPMTPEAERILQSAKEINPDGQFVFMPYGRIMLNDTFNEYLRKYCEAIGIPYLSSHKIRFTSCSLLYRTSSDLGETSQAMGHSQAATTLHYIRNVSNQEKLSKDMERAFAPNRTIKKP